jgi:hypothetical protein
MSRAPLPRQSGVVSVSYPVAREFYRCSCCNGPIEKGDRYRRWTGLADAWTGLATEKRCAACWARYGNLGSA